MYQSLSVFWRAQVWYTINWIFHFVLYCFPYTFSMYVSIFWFLLLDSLNFCLVTQSLHGKQFISRESTSDFLDDKLFFGPQGYPLLILMNLNEDWVFSIFNTSIDSQVERKLYWILVVYTFIYGSFSLWWFFRNQSFIREKHLLFRLCFLTIWM